MQYAADQTDSWRGDGAPLALLKSSGQIVGERGGTAFPFRFWRGNAVPLAYTTAVGGRGGT